MILKEDVVMAEKDKIIKTEAETEEKNIPKADAVLSDEELDQVAGGRDGIPLMPTKMIKTQ